MAVCLQSAADILTLLRPTEESSRFWKKSGRSAEDTHTENQRGSVWYTIMHAHRFFCQVETLILFWWEYSKDSEA